MSKIFLLLFLCTVIIIAILIILGVLMYYRNKSSITDVSQPIRVFSSDFPECFETDSYAKRIYGILLQTNRKEEFAKYIQVLSLLLCINRDNICNTNTIDSYIQQLTAMGGIATDANSIQEANGIVSLQNRNPKIQELLYLITYLLREFVTKWSVKDSQNQYDIKGLVYQLSTNQYPRLVSLCVL